MCEREGERESSRKRFNNLSVGRIMSFVCTALSRRDSACH